MGWGALIRRPISHRKHIFLPGHQPGRFRESFALAALEGRHINPRMNLGTEMPIIPSRKKIKPEETRLAIRVDLASGARIGPGKVRLLEEIDRAGSISAAARAMRITYVQAWWLVDDISKAVGPVIDTYKGGGRYGGASLTKVGRALVAEYRAIEAASIAASRNNLAALIDDLRVP
jgi:molybdate transport system regulatory protein